MQMKRIEATIQGNKIAAVSDAINDIVGGFTILRRKWKRFWRKTRPLEQEEELVLICRIQQSCNC